MELLLTSYLKLNRIKKGNDNIICPQLFVSCYLSEGPSKLVEAHLYFNWFNCCLKINITKLKLYNLIYNNYFWTDLFLIIGISLKSKWNA